MSAPSAFLSGFALCASLIVAIGAQNVFVLRQGLARQHVPQIVIFCALMDLLLVALGVGGGGALLHAIPGLAPALTFGGAIFLTWYGVSALRRAANPGALTAAAAPQTPTIAATLRAAAAFTLLNPHVYLDTVLLMGSIGAAQPPALRPIFVAGAGAASAIWFTALGFGARLLAPLFARPAAWRVLDAIVAAIMLVLAALLVAKTFAP